MANNFHLSNTRKLGITPQEMRAAIFKTANKSTSAIARRCLDTADFEGLNGEDRMTLLAYHALCCLEDRDNALLDSINCSLRPPYIMWPTK